MQNKIPSTPINLKWESKSSIISWDCDENVLNVVYFKNVDLPNWGILTYTQENFCKFEPSQPGEYLIRIKSGRDVVYSDNSEIIEVIIG